MDRILLKQIFTIKIDMVLKEIKAAFSFTPGRADCSDCEFSSLRAEETLIWKLHENGKK